MLLFFDKEIITIVLDNLISNAIKYTEQGRVTLSLYQTMRNEVAYTEIKVSDNIAFADTQFLVLCLCLPEFQYLINQVEQP